jgi:hypothetical protein
MNHQLAVDTRATERYMLGELDEESRSAFEEHYFSCHACAADVKAAAVFVDNAKAVLAALPAAEARVKRPFFFFPWPQSMMPAALAACLAVGYVLPHPAAHAVGGFVATVAIPAGTRSAQSQARVVTVSKDASYFLLKLDVADDVTAPRLSWRVRTAAGRELVFQTERENQAVLPLRATDFPVGQYELILSPESPGSSAIDRYPFTIQYR